MFFKTNSLFAKKPLRSLATVENCLKKFKDQKHTMDRKTEAEQKEQVAVPIVVPQLPETTDSHKVKEKEQVPVLVFKGSCGSGSGCC